MLELTKGAVNVTGGSAEDVENSANQRMPSPRRERPAGATIKSLAFDHVYDEFCTQEDVYDQFVKPFTAQYLAGFNVTLFAYGQTGTGKTHTVIGGDGYDQRGVVPRFVEEVFSHVASEASAASEAKAAGTSAAGMPSLTEAEAADARPLLIETSVESVGVTILEVYEGKVYDLLRSSPLNPSETNNLPRGAPLPREHGALMQLELDVAMSAARGCGDTVLLGTRRRAYGPQHAGGLGGAPRFDAATAHGVARFERGVQPLALHLLVAGS